MFEILEKSWRTGRSRTLCLLASPLLAAENNKDEESAEKTLSLKKCIRKKCINVIGKLTFRKVRRYFRI